MVSLNSIALSGLQAAQTRLNSSAHNVANAQTPGYKREAVRSQADAQGGVNTRVEKSETSGADLAQDLVEQKMATYAFKANAQVIQTSNTLAGSLLDTQA